jgi:hypothetical protein
MTCGSKGSPAFALSPLNCARGILTPRGVAWQAVIAYVREQPAVRSRNGSHPGPRLAEKEPLQPRLCNFGIKAARLLGCHEEHDPNERRGITSILCAFGGVLALMPQSDVRGGAPRNLKMHNANRVSCGSRNCAKAVLVVLTAHTWRLSEYPTDHYLDI